MTPARMVARGRADEQSSLLVAYRSSAQRRWVERVQVHSTLAISFVVGILLALLIAAGAFILLVSQR
jgi:hypothetical protein